jgi:hypothetical protein
MSCQCRTKNGKGPRCTKSPKQNSLYCGLHSNCTNKFIRCKCKTQNGKGEQCSKPAQAGSQYCSIHNKNCNVNINNNINLYNKR